MVSITSPWRVFCVVAALLLAHAAAAARADAPADPASMSPDRLVIVTEEGAFHFTVEIADDPVERARGLMFREDMAHDHGMLFDYGAEGERSFWMKNTILALDLIFARSDGTVISVKSGEPFSEERIPSDGPARFVLEVNAGVAEEVGLEPGDRLVHVRVEDTAVVSPDGARQ
jgi:hypothetical protein